MLSKVAFVRNSGMTKKRHRYLKIFDYIHWRGYLLTNNTKPLNLPTWILSCRPSGQENEHVKWLYSLKGLPINEFSYTKSLNLPTWTKWIVENEQVKWPRHKHVPYVPSYNWLKRIFSARLKPSAEITNFLYDTTYWAGKKQDKDKRSPIIQVSCITLPFAEVRTEKKTRKDTKTRSNKVCSVETRNPPSLHLRHHLNLQ